MPNAHIRELARRRSRLSDIVAELRAAVRDCAKGTWRPDHARAAGSRLLLETIQLGAFDGDEYAELRADVSLAQNKPDADAGTVFFAGTAWLTRHGHMPAIHDMNKAYEALFRGLADAIEARVQTIFPKADSDLLRQLAAGANAAYEFQRQHEEGFARVARNIQGIGPVSETMKEAFREALAEHEEHKATLAPKTPPAIADSTSDQNATASGYTVAALRDMTGLGNSALNRYAKTAGVRTPRQGERNFKYTLANARTILETIVASTAEDKLRNKCKAALQDLTETTE